MRKHETIFKWMISFSMRWHYFGKMMFSSKSNYLEMRQKTPQ